MTTLLEYALTPALGGPRECGPGRQAGHIYAECGFSARGASIDHFLVDVPLRIDPKRLQINSQGVTLIEQGGVYHVLDFVGKSHYHTVADFIEEARAIGISRKLPRTTDFSKLSAASTMILIHPEAHLENAADIAPFVTSSFQCPCAGQPSLRGAVHTPATPCAGWHWFVPEPTHGFTRKLRRTTYTPHPLKPGAPPMILKPGYFVRVPINNLSVVRRQDGSIDQNSRTRANQSTLPVIDVSS